jgi:hypothetical protein
LWKIDKTSHLQRRAWLGRAPVLIAEAPRRRRAGYRASQGRAPYRPRPLEGRDGDRVNAVPAAAGNNFALLLRWLWRGCCAPSSRCSSTADLLPTPLNFAAQSFFTGDIGAKRLEEWASDEQAMLYSPRPPTGYSRSRAAPWASSA